MSLCVSDMGTQDLHKSGYFTYNLTDVNQILQFLTEIYAVGKAELLLVLYFLSYPEDMCADAYKCPFAFH